MKKPADPMRQKRRWLRWFVSSVIVILVGGTVALWIAAGSIAKPNRRELQDYHQSYLDGASDHGIMVTKHDFLDGKAPTLLVRPDRKSGPALRGQTLRKQLSDTGMTLPEYGEEFGLIVLLHGRNGRKEDLLPVAERFCAIGLVCALPDLPAHGESPIKTVGFGSREFEKSLPSKVAEATSKEFSLPPLPHFLWGMSMGGSFAIHAVDHDPSMWDRQIIVASFDHLAGVVGDSLGPLDEILMPAVGMMTDWRGGPRLKEVDPAALAKNQQLPTLVIHGDSDELISIKRGRALFDSFSGPKEFITVPGGTHENVLITKAPVYAAMARWLLAQNSKIPGK